MQIIKTREPEWNERLENLKKCIHYWIENSTEKTVEVIELYYQIISFYLGKIKREIKIEIKINFNAVKILLSMYIML